MSLERENRPYNYVHCIESRNRDRKLYPNAYDFKSNIPIIQGCEQFSIQSITLPYAQYNISSENSGNVLVMDHLIDGQVAMTFSLKIRPSNYTYQSLCDAINSYMCCPTEVLCQLAKGDRALSLLPAHGIRNLTPVNNIPAFVYPPTNGDDIIGRASGFQMGPYFTESSNAGLKSVNFLNPYAMEKIVDVASQITIGTDGGRFLPPLVHFKFNVQRGGVDVSHLRQRRHKITPYLTENRNLNSDGGIRIEFDGFRIRRSETGVAGFLGISQDIVFNYRDHPEFNFTTDYFALSGFLPEYSADATVWGDPAGLTAYQLLPNKNGGINSVCADAENESSGAAPLKETLGISPVTIPPSILPNGIRASALSRIMDTYVSGSVGISTGLKFLGGFQFDNPMRCPKLDTIESKCQVKLPQPYLTLHSRIMGAPNATDTQDSSLLCRINMTGAVQGTTIRYNPNLMLRKRLEMNGVCDFQIRDYFGNVLNSYCDDDNVIIILVFYVTDLPVNQGTVGLQ